MQQQRDTTGESVPTLFRLPDCSPQPEASEFSDQTQISSTASNQPQDRDVDLKREGSRSIAPIINSTSESDQSATLDTFPHPKVLTDQPTRDARTRNDEVSESLDASAPTSFLHEPHLGPPANHVRRPPDNQGSVRPQGPAPHVPQAAQPATSTAWGSTKHVVVNDAESSVKGRVRTAAYHDEGAPAWSESATAKWLTRTTMGVGMIALIALGYFYGRGTFSQGDSTDSDQVAFGEMDSEQMAYEQIVMELAVQEEHVEQPVADSEAGNGSSPHPETSVALRSNDEILADIGSLPDDTGRALSVVAEESSDNSTNASLGTPTTATSDLPTYSPAIPEFPDLGEDIPDSPSGLIEGTSAGPRNPGPLDDVPLGASPLDSTVAYRAEQLSQVDELNLTNPGLKNETPNEPLADLPAGMADRLKLEDGLRYTNTPYPIGNFLEILEAWEAAARY
ncbi:MAG: hypothetical protein AAF802_08965 [Planctomycetota bacterium]